MRPDGNFACMTQPTTRRRPRWIALVGLAICVAPAVISLVLQFRKAHHDHQGWIFVAATSLTIPLVFGLVWLLTVSQTRRAKTIQTQNPGSWVRPMTMGRRGNFLLYLDAHEIKLIGLTGHVSRRYPRNQLTSAVVGDINYPLGSRPGLILTFADGGRLSLLTGRRGGMTSSLSDAEAAVAFLRPEH